VLGDQSHRAAESSGNKPAPSTLCVQLRDLVDADLPVFFEQQLDADANHMAAFTCKNPADRDAFNKHWARIIDDPTILKKTILFDERVARHVMSFEQAGEREVCYWIGKEFWGRRIATRALIEFLKHVNIRPLFARVASDNFGSIRVLEKCGFEMCGKGKWFSNARGVEIEELILKLSIVSVVSF
jgi:RimJ/RimL family protein N-acetyltransferase